MEPSHYLAVVRKHWIIILTVTLLGMGAALGLSLREPKTYRSTTTVFLSLTQGDSVSELVQGSTYAHNLVTSYKQIATQPVVLSPVIEKLGLDTTPRSLAHRITTDSPLDTVLITITATDTVPERAASIANAVGKQLSTAVAELSPTGPGPTSFVRVTTVAPAQVPTYPSSPRKKLALAVGLALGLAAGAALALVRELIDTRVRATEDIESITDRPVIGKITYSDNAHANALLEEEFRYLRTNLMSVTVDERPRSVVVTSSSSGEGKTTVAINLALALAQSDLRVVLVDADLRRPAVARYLQIEGSAGLTNALIGDAPVGALIQTWGTHHLSVLAAGAVVPNPSELLGSRSMAQLLSRLQDDYDIVVLDGAPLAVTDSASLSRHTDGTLVVVNARHTQRKQLARSLATLELLRIRVFGIVLNQTPPDRRAEHYSTYGPDVDSPKGRRRTPLLVQDETAPPPSGTTTTLRSPGETTPHPDTVVPTDPPGDTSPAGQRVEPGDDEPVPPPAPRRAPSSTVTQQAAQPPGWLPHRSHLEPATQASAEPSNGSARPPRSRKRTRSRSTDVRQDDGGQDPPGSRGDVPRPSAGPGRGPESILPRGS